MYIFLYKFIVFYFFGFLLYNFLKKNIVVGDSKKIWINNKKKIDKFVEDCDVVK